MLFSILSRSPKPRVPPAPLTVPGRSRPVQGAPTHPAPRRAPARPSRSPEARTRPRAESPAPLHLSGSHARARRPRWTRPQARAVPPCATCSLEGGARGSAEKMFLLPLPAAGRVALRRLGVSCLRGRSLATADMTKVRGGSCSRATAGVLPAGDLGAGQGGPRPRRVRLLRQVTQID